VKLQQAITTLELSRGMANSWPIASAGGELLCFLDFRAGFEELLQGIRRLSSLGFPMAFRLADGQFLMAVGVFQAGELAALEWWQWVSGRWALGAIALGSRLARCRPLVATGWDAPGRFGRWSQWRLLGWGQASNGRPDHRSVFPPAACRP